MISLLNRDAWWDAIESRLGDNRLIILLAALAIIGALGIAAASEIGIRYFNTEWNNVLGYSVQRDRDWRPFFSLWAATAIIPIAQGSVAAMLLKLYSQPRLWLPSVAVAVVGSIPIYIAGVTLIVLPGIFLFAIAFLISCGWWVSGGCRLLGLRYSEAPEHVAVSIAISGALMLLVSATLPL